MFLNPHNGGERLQREQVDILKHFLKLLWHLKTLFLLMKFWFHCLSFPRNQNCVCSGRENSLFLLNNCHLCLYCRVTWLTLWVCAIGSTCWTGWCHGWRRLRHTPAPLCMWPTPHWVACPLESSSQRGGSSWKGESYISTVEDGRWAVDVSADFQALFFVFCFFF